MIDANQLVLDWMLTPSLTINGELVVNQVPVLLASLLTPGGAYPNNTADRIYAGHLIPGFDAKYGPGGVIRIGPGTSAGTGGGSAHPEAPIISPRVQMTWWAPAAQYDMARKLYRASFDWMHGRNNLDFGDVGYILSCLEQVEGQDYDDPQSGLATNISFWQVKALRD